MQVELDNIPKHIKIGKKSKIANPYNKGNANKFYGNVADFDFKHQRSNYEELSKKLLEIGVRFDLIWSSSIERRFTQNSVQYGTTFIITTTNPSIFWYKYEGHSIGSGGNHILIGYKKIKVSEFIKLNKDDILKLLH
jgi:hypothetical protein